MAVEGMKVGGVWAGRVVSCMFESGLLWFGIEICSIRHMLASIRVTLAQT